MHRVLHPHPTTDAGGLTLEVEARRAGRVLSLDYRLTGPVQTVRWPEPAPPVHTDGLWRTTCFEAFARAPTGYREINLSPSGAWATYAFDAYREGMRSMEGRAPLIVVRHAPGLVSLTADVDIGEATGPFGLSAVIERLDGSVSYWALAHPSDKPDFHHPDSFVLDLP